MQNIKREPAHPGEILIEEFLKPLGITQSALAKELKTSFRTINELANKKRGISAETAIKLAQYFGTTPELWLNLQNQYDLYRAVAKKPGLITGIKPRKTGKKAA